MDTTHVTRTGPEGFEEWTRPISPALRQSVSQLAGFVNSGTVLVRHRELPLVGTPIILGFGATYRLSDALDPDLPVHERSHFIAGLHETYSTSASTGPGWTIQINLTPPGAFTVFGMPLRDVTNQIVPFDAVAGAPGRQLITDLEQSTTWDERFDLVEAFLSLRQVMGPRLDQSLLWSLRQLEPGPGLSRISTLAEELRVSRRHFTARFSEQIGLSPKLVARQLRFASAQTLLLGSDLSIAGIAAQLGYADQAHLTREFRAFAGETPARFRDARDTG